MATTLHRLEQAKYWSDLKQRHTSQVLAAKQRSAIEGQMADCMRSTEAPPAAELVAMVQAACEEEVCPIARKGFSSWCSHCYTIYTLLHYLHHRLLLYTSLLIYITVLM